ncbi:MAG: hypothetical protein EOO85_28255 [Pedobacter sp.]|nr:MAG: hypothetical protein EOO85_28255 [Pedobacter sp.]
MISKAATDYKTLKVGKDVIVISTVKGDDNLLRVSINNDFVGYVQKREGDYYRLDGHSIHDLVFARLCTMI